jgi:hypothetical protein
VQFFDDAVVRLGRVAGVHGAVVTTALPLEGDIQIDILSLENDPRPPGERPPASIRYVSPAYFKAVGKPLREGRIFAESDRARSVVVLSERAAQSLWPDESPLGKRVWPGSNDTLAEVIGVVADVRTSSLEAEGTLIAYVPYWQNAPVMATLLVRTAADPTTIAGTVRNELRALGPVLVFSKEDEIVGSVGGTAGHRAEPNGDISPQLTACFTSVPILASSAAVNFFNAKEVGHMAPSSRFASSLKPNVAYRDLNFCALWKKQTTLPSLA